MKVLRVNYVILKSSNFLKFIIITIFGVFLYSCQVTESDTKNYIEKFNANKVDFGKLALEINEYKVLSSKGDNEIYSKFEDGLNDLNIQRINISKTSCKDVFEIEFTTSWSKNATVYFTKNECVTEQSNVNYHSKSEMIEVWGLGNGWIMWIDYDFI